MQGLLPCSPGTVKADAHNTIDAQRHVGEPYRMGVNGAHNTVWGNVDAYNTICVREAIEYGFCMCTGYGPGIVV